MNYFIDKKNYIKKLDIKTILHDKQQLELEIKSITQKQLNYQTIKNQAQQERDDFEMKWKQLNEDPNQIVSFQERMKTVLDSDQQEENNQYNIEELTKQVEDLLQYVEVPQNQNNYQLHEIEEEIQEPSIEDC